MSEKKSTYPVKILHITGGLGLGGSERQLFLTLKYLPKDKFEHHVINLNPQQNFLTRDIENLGAYIWDVPGNDKSNLYRLYKLIKLCGSIKPDAVHSWSYYANLYAGLCGLLTGVPLRIGSLRNSYGYTSELPRIIRFISERTIHYLLVNSHAALSEIQMNGFPVSHLRYVPNIVEIPDTAELSSRIDIPGFKPGSFLIGTIGNIRHQKNHRFLIDAVAKLSQKYSVQAVIVGQEVDTEPGLKTNLKDLIKDYGIEDRILFLGFRQDIYSLLNQFNLFCLTSDHEGMPNVILEAMAAGKPVISTDVGDVAEVIHDGVNGILVRPGDVDGFVDALERLIESPDLIGKMREESLDRIKKYHSPEVALKQLEFLYLNGKFEKHN